MLLHLCQSFCSQGVSATPWADTPLSRHLPWADTPLLSSACWDTVNKRVVGIPLECILVLFFLPPANQVWGRVIFLHVSVILFTGGAASRVRGLHPGGLGRTPPPFGIRKASGTHPTGILSCLKKIHIITLKNKRIHNFTVFARKSARYNRIYSKPDFPIE